MEGKGHVEEEDEDFVGFTDEESSRLYPIVESTSRKLFLMVKELRIKYAHSLGDAIVKCGEPVVIPKDSLDFQGGSDIVLEKIRYEGDNVVEVEEENNFVAIEEVRKTARMKVDGEGKPGNEEEVAAGTAVRSSGNRTKTTGPFLSSFHLAFSPAELELLRKPMEEG